MTRSRVMMNLSVFSLALGLLVSATQVARATPSQCDAVPGNLVNNCGFEGGAYTSIVGGNTNTSVPNGWTADAAFDLEPSFNHLTGSPVNSGLFGLSIGNFDAEPTPNLSQILTDQAGVTASGSIFVAYGAGTGADGGAFFDVLVNGVAVLALNDTIPNGYGQYTFSFVGTGSDTLALAAKTNPSEWFADDVTVTQPVSVPEPATMGLVLAALAGVTLGRWRSRPSS